MEGLDLPASVWSYVKLNTWLLFLHISVHHQASQHKHHDFPHCLSKKHTCMSTTWGHGGNEDLTILPYLVTVWQVSVQTGHWPVCSVRRPSLCHNSFRCWCHPVEAQSRCVPLMPQQRYEPELSVWWGPAANKSTRRDLRKIMRCTDSGSLVPPKQITEYHFSSVVHKLSTMRWVRGLYMTIFRQSVTWGRKL